MSVDNPKKLGFGLMRLPRKRVNIDVGHTARMVDEFIEAGCTYFDTAYVYPGSEKATRKALVERYPRESYTIASKMMAALATTRSFCRREIKTSLRRLGTSYIDYYLLHAVSASNIGRYEDMGLWDFAAELKREGLVHHVGFSFHDSPELLDELLTRHPEVEFVQLQINYLDWEDKRVQSRANWEVARSHDKPIVIMEPVKGGKLAKPIPEVRELLERANPDASPASWAIRFAASLDGVRTVLSGMSNIDQMRDNLSFMRDFKPLSEEERAVIRQAQEILGGLPSIPCTGCGYCLEGCPQQIDIPRHFAAANDRLIGGSPKPVEGTPASECIGCGQCESICPQHISIIEELARIA